MDTVSQILVVVALVAGGISTMQLNTVRTLRADRDDYKERDARRITEIADLRTELASVKAEMGAEIVTLKNDRDALQRTMRGDDHFDNLGVKVDQMTAQLNVLSVTASEHNDSAKHHWQQEILLLTTIRDALSRLPEEGS